MLQDRQVRQDYFRTLLRTVVGQAFDAAGYELEKTPLQWAGGKYRFVKAFADGYFGLIDFQALVSSDTMWSSGAPSRFKVQLTRSRDRHGRARDETEYITRGLSQWSWLISQWQSCPQPIIGGHSWTLTRWERRWRKRGAWSLDMACPG